MYRIFIFIAFVLFVACSENKEPDKSKLPWSQTSETRSDTSAYYSLGEILDNGELIMLTISGPDTYFVEREQPLGVQYLLCEKLTKELGVMVRVEACQDTLEMVQKLRNGEGDLIAMPISKTIQGNDSLLFCGPGDEDAQWAVMEYNKLLADTINSWYTPDLLAEVDEEMENIFNGMVLQRHVYDPILNEANGEISTYDDLFKKYADQANVDWRLMAAICYQESCFDPDARSWAGACGLMQLMPATAQAYGLDMTQIFNPEMNIEVSAKVVNDLITLFRDVPDTTERLNFVLASYNGGLGHVRDAMALTAKYGGDMFSWEEVSEYILLLREPRYYHDAVVKFGYLRGSETYDYVELVRERYEQYAAVTGGNSVFYVDQPGEMGGVSTVPRRASGENKYQI